MIIFSWRSRWDRFFRIKSDQFIRPWGREFFFGSKNLVCLEPQVFFHEECSVAYFKKWLVRWYEPIRSINLPWYFRLRHQTTAELSGTHVSIYTFSKNHVSAVCGVPPTWTFPLKYGDLKPWYIPLGGRKMSRKKPCQISSLLLLIDLKGCEQKQMPVGDFLQLPPGHLTCFLEKVYTSFQRNGYFWYLFNLYIFVNFFWS